MPVSDAPTNTVGYVAEPSTASPWAIDLDRIIDEVPELTDRRRAVRVYSSMRRDPQLAAILRAVGLLLQRATWTVDDAGASDAMTRQVADDLGLAVIGGDKPSVGRVRGVLWPEHLRMALLELAFGHMGFEIEATVTDGRARLAGLYERMPGTIAEINHDRQGRLTSITQDPLGTEKPRPIAAENLLWYAHEREGAAWRGQSLLRPAYGAWLIKHELWRVHATGIRRFSAGIPTLSTPPGATPQQITEAQRAISRARGGELAGLALPAGYEARIQGIVGNVPDPLDFIKYLDQQMSRMVLAQFMDLGSTESGSRALGSSFVDFFTMTVEAIANEVANTVTRQLCVRLTDWNEGEGAPAPAISVADVGTKHEVTAEAIKSLIDCGALTPDEGVEDFLRQTWRLPRRTAPRPPRPVQAPRETRVAAAAGEPDDDEASTGQEAADSLDAEWQTALIALLLLYRRKRHQDVEDIVARVRDLAIAGDLAGLTGLTATTTGEGVDAIAQAMGQLASTGAASAVREAAAQGVTLAAPDTGALAAGLRARAAVVDDLLTSGLANSAVREATRKWGLTPDELAGEVRTALEQLSDSWVEGHLGGALTSAQNDGRGLVFAESPAASFTAVEVLDATVCRPCAQVAGRTYPTWEAALLDYPAGQFRSCLGRERCRGFLLANYTGSV